ncbi:hypothetical protein [Cryobacterium sp. Y62]|uniref:hypothetical protein n=1 Tax=Cryobacterium sp. Y62 TaxID=2048284 RepID=UPI000CE4C4DA|nr:hypothetical protein [Cryobacterium sp. Y62]
MTANTRDDAIAIAAAAVRSTKAEVRRIERLQHFEGLLKGFVAHVHRNRARFSVHVEMENRARGRRGKPDELVESLVVQLAVQEVIEYMPTRNLTVEDVRTVARIARLRIAIFTPDHLGMVDVQIQRGPVR